ncbi:MAG: hypothetical protein IJ435_07985 [Clostridia bacterium]|nr:hypothetical protein [Clostridia bacterium]
MTEKARYTQKAPIKGNAKLSMTAFVLLALAIMVLLVVVNFLPYSGILTLCVFALGAYFIHRLLNRTIFDVTYALFDDKLIFLRKYGIVEWECEVFPFDEAKFYADKIEHRGKSYEFHPDEKLKEFLGI